MHNNIIAYQVLQGDVYSMYDVDDLTSYDAGGIRCSLFMK